MSTLASKGYAKADLLEYIKRQLGYPIWCVEMTDDQIMDSIQDALMEYSQWRPSTSVIPVQLAQNVNRYLEGVDVGQGVVQVDFVERLPTPTNIFYGNLIDPAPLMKTGMDDYDTFQRWRKTFMRVTSIQPDWHYDDMNQVLFIHNPIARWMATAWVYGNFEDTATLPAYGANWVKNYALARARYVYGEILSKFSGAIPGPVQNLQLDQQKRQEASQQIEKLITELRNAQFFTPISID